MRYLVEFRDHDDAGEPITHADIEDALSAMLTTHGHDGIVIVSMVAVLTPQENPHYPHYPHPGPGENIMGTEHDD